MKLFSHTQDEALDCLRKHREETLGDKAMLSATFKAFAFLGVLLCGVGMLSASTSAAVLILYVSTSGNNSNPCSLAQPCRSLQYAINRTPDGGEVHILNSGFYGNRAQINRTISIAGNGHTVSLGVPILIEAAFHRVAFRNLSLIGGGSVEDGIKISAASSVHVERVVVSGFLNNGIWADNFDGRIHISNSVLRNNNNNGLAISGSANTRLSVENSRFVSNLTGVLVHAGQAMIARSEMSGGMTGVSIGFGGSATIAMSILSQNANGVLVNHGEAVVDSSVIRGSVTAGINAELSTSVVRLSNVTVVSNAVGIDNDGTLFTRQNNMVVGNGTDYFGSGAVKNITAF